ncbi:MAG: polysaccharide deacetylase family protein [Planctomycetota bacterium]
MKSGALVLMYHALTREGVFDRAALNPADRGYAIEADLLAGHLAVLSAPGRKASLPPEWTGETSRKNVPDLEAENGGSGGALKKEAPLGNAPAVILTFDDSWESHQTLAWPLIQKAGMRAVFFLTVQEIGRPFMLTWDGVRALARAGAVIGSHGLRHRFFDAYNEADLRAELAASRRALEEAAGLPVRLLALPGGRSRPDMMRIAREAGYARVFGSRPGQWSGAEAAAGEPLPRVAVTERLTPERFARFLERPEGPIAWRRVRYEGLKGLRALLGEGLYGRLRNRLPREA